MARNQTRSLGHLQQLLDKKMPQHLDLETLLEVPYSEPGLIFKISPVGSESGFSWNQPGRWEIYTLSLEKNTSPRIITQGHGPIANPVVALSANSNSTLKPWDCSDQEYECLLYLNEDIHQYQKTNQKFSKHG
jgi:hypothetical protein